jgi:hypothetical protein
MAPRLNTVKKFHSETIKLCQTEILKLIIEDLESESAVDDLDDFNFWYSFLVHNTTKIVDSEDQDDNNNNRSSGSGHP